ncbi:HD domain-containing protein [Candidatus Leptofilum sp.]|uniref:HD domain-containing protein n=1 Tax=Candidatus Leptofilum sp. TaxID=3241576 RepID=UPI003B5A4202
MKKATQKEALNRFGAADPLFHYRWEHVTAVVTLALKLAELTGADAEVVEAAAWLHDIRKDVGPKHPQEGAKFAHEILPTTDFPKKKIGHVARCIRSHMGLWRRKPLKNLEAQVLWDADKLAKMGLTSLFHFMPVTIMKGNGRTTQELINNARANQSWLPKTVASMHTKPAQKAAKKRLKRFNQLLDRLEAELAGDDLLG